MTPMNFPTPYQVPFNQPHVQQYNTFTKENETSTAQPDNTSATLDQIVKLLANRNVKSHQIQEVQATTHVIGSMWDFSDTAELLANRNVKSHQIQEVQATTHAVGSTWDFSDTLV